MLPRSKRVSVTVGILVGMFLASLEATVVGTAMPTIVASLGGLEIYSWVFSAYLLASTVTIPIWGKLSDLHGRRKTYLIAVAVFLVGSMASGQAQSMGQLIVFRALQGLGAGGLLPLSLTIVAELYSPVERVRIQGFFSAVWGLASILGPLAGGFLTDQINWRWVFYINIPFGLVALAIIGTQLVEDLSPHRRRRIDVPGIALFTAAITLFMILLVRSETSFDWSSPISIALLAGSGACLFAFLSIERRATEPLLPVDLLRNKVFVGSTLNGFFAGMAMFGLISFIPLFVQGVQGTGATEAGTVLTPILLGWVVFSAVGGRLLFHFTFRQVMFVGMLLMVTGFLLLVMMEPSAARIVLLRNAAILGAGMGLSMIVTVIAIQANVEREQLGIATSLSQFFRSVGGAIGVALMGTVLTQTMNRQIAQLAANIPAGSTLMDIRQLADNPDALLRPFETTSIPAALVGTFRSMLANALHSVFVVGTIISVLALASVLLMPAGKLRK